MDVTALSYIDVGVKKETDEYFGKLFCNRTCETVAYIVTNITIRERPGGLFMRETYFRFDSFIVVKL